MKIDKKRDETTSREQKRGAPKRPAPVIRVRSQLRAGIMEEIQPIDPGICC